MKCYAGIGSRRRVPTYILGIMTKLATKLEDMDYTLRSGHAQGCDRAFEDGVLNDANKEIFTAKDATPASMAIAEEYHGFWDNCDEYTRKLHGRNVMIILGKNFKEPVKFVVCYTPDGKCSGGTGLGMLIAKSRGIPIFNLFYKEAQERIKKFIGTPERMDLL